MVDCAGEHDCGVAGVDAVRGTANRVQPDRADTGTGVDGHGRSAGPDGDGVVAAGEWVIDRKICKGFERTKATG